MFAPDTLPPLDTGFVRAQFPAFAEPDLAGQMHFDNAGGSYACGAVIARLQRFYQARKVQPFGPHPASCAGGEEMEEARTRLAAMLGVASDELGFGPSTSANAHVLANAFRRYLRPGDAIVVTNQDHEANSGFWRRLVEDGIEVREWQIDAGTGRLETATLAPLLHGRVRLVCFPHCSNVIGEINDVAAICALVRAAGAYSCVDGVSFVPHAIPDVSALGADIYLFSTYKTYGPHQGVMAIRRELAEELPVEGHWFNARPPSKRLVPAGPDHAQVAACAGIADYLDALWHHHFPDLADPGPKARAAAVSALMRAHETRLLGPLLDTLNGRRGIRLLGPARPEGRAPTVALALPRPGAEAAAALAVRGIIAGGGDFYARRPLEALGIDPDRGVLRLSFVHYAEADEVDRLIAALDCIL